MNCTHPKCPGRGVWRPLLEMRATTKDIPRKATFADLVLCEKHKDQAKLSDFISTSTWDKIVRFVREAGKPAPKRNLTILRFIVVGSPESTPEDELPF